MTPFLLFGAPTRGRPNDWLARIALKGSASNPLATRCARLFRLERPWGDYTVELSPKQCRAARGWLDWSVNKLAIKAGVATSTVRDFEKRRRVPTPKTLAAMQDVFEREGLFFTADGITSRPSESLFALVRVAAAGS